MSMIFTLHASAKETVDELATQRQLAADELQRKREEEANRAEVVRHCLCEM